MDYADASRGTSKHEDPFVRSYWEEPGSTPGYRWRQYSSAITPAMHNISTDASAVKRNVGSASRFRHLECKLQKTRSRSELRGSPIELPGSRIAIRSYACVIRSFPNATRGSHPGDPIVPARDLFVRVRNPIVLARNPKITRRDPRAAVRDPLFADHDPLERSGDPRAATRDATCCVPQPRRARSLPPCCPRALVVQTTDERFISLASWT